LSITFPFDENPNVNQLASAAQVGRGRKVVAKQSEVRSEIEIDRQSGVIIRPSAKNGIAGGLEVSMRVW
jgi:hypothetical protein